jgi:protein FAM32A
MPSSDYASVSGGALKLKGGSGVEKKRKKKKTKTDGEKTNDAEPGASKSMQEMLEEEDKLDREEKNEEDEGGTSLSEELKRDLVEYRGKTEAERRHEERRRKMVRHISASGLISVPS